MKKNSGIYRFTLIVLIMCMFTLVFMPIKQVSAQQDSGVLLKVNTEISYPNDRNVIIQIQALTIIDGTIPNEKNIIKIFLQVNNTWILLQTLNLNQKEIREIDLGRYDVGIYCIQVTATCKGMSSKTYETEFGITYPPVNYNAFFIGGGTNFIFETRNQDLNKTFTVTMSVDDGSSIVVAQVFNNVTYLKVRCPQDIVSVRFDVADCYGWKNYENRPDDNCYTGNTYMYLYHSELIEPMKSHTTTKLIMILVGIVIIAGCVFYLNNRVYENVKKEEEW